MIWMSWRQFRTQALAGVVVLGALSAYLIKIGLDVRDARDGYLAQCQVTGDCAGAMVRLVGDYRSPLLVLAGVLGLVPVLIGMFWGAPLVARELEAGTHRLVWNQSVSRRRWLAVRLATVVLAAMVVGACASLLLSWAAAPIDAIAQDRFGTVNFGARGLSPVGQAALAAALGAAVGMFSRRTLPAMAVTGLLVLIMLFVMPNAIRPHLMPAHHESRHMTAAAIDQAHGLGTLGNAPVLKGIEIPGVWVTSVSELLTADGRPLDPKVFDDCLMRAPKTGATGTFGDSSPCLESHDLHLDIAYQPNDRFWAFQCLETGLYLLLTGLVAALMLWSIRHRT
ncbi:ABC transporter permease subunit [Dactylosporangium vinaceum]|uniref:ABC transporter permease subunit n=1 Tax=Dactylosporangium vinaceum TaxID=53362 RepID=A0ABV5MF90_9ACTN|nr:ABC transporter permease subunit [Dactylosporangium vinaceum]UAB98683.1 ABC transporter permease subunit [Dactylosporangium vinaceum]